MNHDLRAEVTRLVDMEVPYDWRESAHDALRPLVKAIELVVELAQKLAESERTVADLRVELLQHDELRMANARLQEDNLRLVSARTVEEEKSNA